MRTDINHRDDDTTSICEGFHSAAKALLRAEGRENQRVDRLVYFLLNVVAEMMSYRDVRQHFCAQLWYISLDGVLLPFHCSFVSSTVECVWS